MAMVSEAEAQPPAVDAAASIVSSEVASDNSSTGNSPSRMSLGGADSRGPSPVPSDASSVESGGNSRVSTLTATMVSIDERQNAEGKQAESLKEASAAEEEEAEQEDQEREEAEDSGHEVPDPGSVSVRHAKSVYPPRA